MNIEQAVITELKALVTNKAYPVEAPQNTSAPYITVAMTNREEENCLDGYSGLVKKYFDIEAYAGTYADMKTLQDAIITEAKTWQLSTIASTGPYVQQVEIDNTNEFYQTDVNMHWCLVEIIIHY